MGAETHIAGTEKQIITPQEEPWCVRNEDRFRREEGQKPLAAISHLIAAEMRNIAFPGSRTANKRFSPEAED